MTTATQGEFWQPERGGPVYVHDGERWLLVGLDGVKLTPAGPGQHSDMDKTLHRARVLFDKGSREAILDFLQEIDPNGTWTDRASRDEGLDPLTYDEALIELQDVIEELETEQRAATVA